MPLTLYGIPNCDTVKKARAWLAEQGVAYTFHDFKKAGVPADRLDAWLDQLGDDRVMPAQAGTQGFQTPLLNRQGTTWRKLDPGAQLRAGNKAGARALMLEQPSVIKRPVVEWPDGTVTVGFDPAQWAARRSS